MFRWHHHCIVGLEKAELKGVLVAWPCQLGEKHRVWHTHSLACYVWFWWKRHHLGHQQVCAVWISYQLVCSMLSGILTRMYVFRFTEDGCPHKKFFHTRYLMRMRLTPDCSKMLISTSSGYLLILHDLDLTQSLEVGSYRILRARRAPLSTGMHVKRLARKDFELKVLLCSGMDKIKNVLFLISTNWIY